MKAFKKIVEGIKDKETIKFLSWLLCYSIVMSGIVTLVHISPLWGLIVGIAFLGSVWTLFNWMK